MVKPTANLVLTREELKVFDVAISKAYQWQGGVFGVRLQDLKKKFDDCEANLIFQEQAQAQVPPVQQDNTQGITL